MASQKMIIPIFSWNQFYENLIQFVLPKNDIFVNKKNQENHTYYLRSLSDTHLLYWSYIL